MIRVLLVDDSPTARRLCARILSHAGDIQVVGEAENPFVARDRIVELEPDVLLLDVEMPQMDGVTFLRRLMHYRPMPVVICSSHTERAGRVALEAMQAGAVEVICKPNETYTPDQMAVDLIAAIRTAAISVQVNRSAAETRTPQAAETSQAARHISGVRTQTELVAIGGSTGGTLVIEEVLAALPPGLPPILIVQHMPAYITKPFADRLQQLSRMNVDEARDGELLEINNVRLAPGGKHMLVERVGGQLRLRVYEGPRVNGHRPAVDVLFQSAAQTVKNRAVGILLTGMGRDGSQGLLTMKNAGAYTFAQDEASSAIFGMPRAAIELGAVDEVLSPKQLPARLVSVLTPRALPSRLAR